jgi:hypothetical protein
MKGVVQKVMSSDILDQAAELEQLERDTIIQNHRNKAAIKLPRTGFCYNCAEPTTELFCDSDCRDDYDYRLKRQQANRV